MPKKIFFTPGPSALYFTVEEHLKKALKEQVAEINHRSPQAEGYFKAAQDNLKEPHSATTSLQGISKYYVKNKRSRRLC